MAALAAGRGHRDMLKGLMAKKAVIGDLLNHLRLARQRATAPPRPRRSAVTAAEAAGEHGAAAAAAAVHEGGLGLHHDSLLSSSSSPPPPQLSNGAAAAAAAAAVLEGSGGSRGGLLSCGIQLSVEDEEALNETLAELLLLEEVLDGTIAPMLEQDGRHFNERCGGGGWYMGCVRFGVNMDLSGV